MAVLRKKNEDFFSVWSSQMAYVFGFFVADGNLSKGRRGNCYVEFTSTDKEILLKIRDAIQSDHVIGVRNRNVRWKTSYRLQLGSKKMFMDLERLGVTINKSKVIRFPFVPLKYLANFVRGYFDGDGSVLFSYFRRVGRTKKSPVLLTRFTSGSEDFLISMRALLLRILSVRGSLSWSGGAWCLCYSMNDSKKLFSFMYGGNLRDLIYLKRKYRIYSRACIRGGSSAG